MKNRLKKIAILLCDGEILGVTRNISLGKTLFQDYCEEGSFHSLQLLTGYIPRDVKKIQTKIHSSQGRDQWLVCDTKSQYHARLSLDQERIAEICDF